MAILFDLTLLNFPNGTKQHAFGHPCTGAEEAGLIGCYVAGVPYKPKFNDVRACLPPQWRKAFDRTNGAWWQYSEETERVHCRLYDARGRWMETITATIRRA